VFPFFAGSVKTDHLCSVLYTKKGPG